MAELRRRSGDGGRIRGHRRPAGRTNVAGAGGGGAWRASGSVGVPLSASARAWGSGARDAAARRGGARAFTGAIAKLRRRPRRGRQQRAGSVPPRTARRATVAGPRAEAGDATGAARCWIVRAIVRTTRSRCHSRICPLPSSPCRPPERSSGVSCNLASNVRPTGAGASPHSSRSRRQSGSTATRTVTPPPLQLALPFERSRELLLVVDEGDNRPLPVTGVRLLLPGWQLRFHRPPGPLRLIYGKDDIGNPHYDVAVLAPSVMTGAARDVVVEPERAPESPATIVSPRAFWVGLGVAVVLLLGLLVRLISSGTAPPPSRPGP